MKSMKPVTATATNNGKDGFITLATSMAILVLTTLVVFNVSKGVLLEQKIMNNENRAKQAFEAAEAGMIAALKYVQEDPDVNGDGTVDSVFDTNGDGVGDTNTATVGTGSVTVTVTDTSGEMTAFTIVATGYSDDKSATRVITQKMTTINPLPNSPDNPLVTKGGVVITGSATVHNHEGQSTIWSGSDVDMGSNNSTHTQVPDPSESDYPSCMDTPMTCTLQDASNRYLKGVDVVENDTSLSSLTADEFFRNFFGMSKATYKASMVTISTTPAAVEDDIDLATHEVIWVDGNTDIGTVTMGCTVSVTGNNVCDTAKTKPSILIVDGNLTFSGTPQFYGIIFVTGSVTISGNTSVHGSLVVSGNTTSSTGGSLDVYYNSTTLSGTKKAGASTGTAGTWKDF